TGAGACWRPGSPCPVSDRPTGPAAGLTASRTPWLRRLGQVLDGSQASVPLGGELRHPRSGGGELLWQHGVEALAARAAARDEVDVLEYGEVLDDSLAADRQLGA